MLEEIVDTVDRLKAEFEAIAIRGIRASGGDDIALLKAAGEELERIGAAHLSQCVAELVAAIETSDASAAAALLRAQTSLRLFDRILTLDVAESSLARLTAEGQ